MAQGFVDNQTINVPCPQCRRKVAARVGQLKRDPTLRCPAGHAFDVDAKQLVRDLEQVEKSIANFGKGFKF